MPLNYIKKERNATVVASQNCLFFLQYREQKYNHSNLGKTCIHEKKYRHIGTLKPHLKYIEQLELAES